MLLELALALVLAPLVPLVLELVQLVFEPVLRLFVLAVVRAV